MNEFFRLKSFLEFQWLAKTKYYIHSPFVYQFYLNVLEGDSDTQLRPLQLLRRELSRNTSPISIEDFGTGKQAIRTIAGLESAVAIREKYGVMLYRLLRYYKPASVLELGTSIGISSAYAALAATNARIISLEGSQNLAAQAKHNHTRLGLKNIEIVCGEFLQTLPAVLSEHKTFDLILFDGNHTKHATLKYFNLCLPSAHEDSVFVFDDINWSEDMQQAWYKIKKHPQITLTIDLFQMGICFFKKGKLAKEDFMLRY